MKAFGSIVGVTLLLGGTLLSYGIFFGQNEVTSDSNVVGSTIIGAYQKPPVANSDVGTDEADDTPERIITGTTDIPLYPDAQDVESPLGYYDKPGGGEYSFRSGASLDKVLSFYKRELGKNGWIVDAEFSSATSHRIHFSWINPVKEIPIRRHLFLSITAGPPGFGCRVRLTFERWPDPEYVPLYPDAQQVQVVWAKDAEIDYLERVTTYETEADVSEIEAYYKDVMVEHGWMIGRSEPNNLFFSYRHDLPCPQQGTSTRLVHRMCGTGSLVEIITYQQENGTTKVELRVGGNEVQALYKGK